MFHIGKNFKMKFSKFTFWIASSKIIFPDIQFLGFNIYYDIVHVSHFVQENTKTLLTIWTSQLFSFYFILCNVCAQIIT